MRAVSASGHGVRQMMMEVKPDVIREMTSGSRPALRHLKVVLAGLGNLGRCLDAVQHC